MVATKCSVLGAKCPAKELRLSWAGYGSSLVSEVTGEVISGSGVGRVIIGGSVGSSSSTMKRNTLEAQW